MTSSFTRFCNPIAMQKVVGSSPISRFGLTRSPERVFRFLRGPTTFPLSVTLRSSAGKRFSGLLTHCWPDECVPRDDQGVFGARADQLRELPAGVGADVEDRRTSSRPSV
jgi:hypothetical protein